MLKDLRAIKAFVAHALYFRERCTVGIINSESRIFCKLPQCGKWAKNVLLKEMLTPCSRLRIGHKARI